MDEVLGRRGQTLEDMFFAKQDAVLIEKLRELEKMEQSLKALSAVSGITNEAVLKKLVELNIHPDLLATLAVVPLVEVAWADGEVQPKERRAIMEGAASVGLGKGSVNRALLEEWLKQRPPAKLLDAWTHYIAGLSEVLTNDERESLKSNLLDRARAVAEAAGGFLGIGSAVSRAEQAVIAQMAAAFVPSKGS